MAYLLLALVILFIIKSINEHDIDSVLKVSLTKLLCIEYKKSQRKNPSD